MAMVSALDVPPSLGSKPVSLKVDCRSLKRAEEKNDLVELLRSLYQAGEFCDVRLACGEQSFPCHKMILASKSPVFRQGLAMVPHTAAAPSHELPEVKVVEVSNPEAVKFMLDYMYEVDPTVWQDYNPHTQEITKDVLQLALRFELPGLTQRATRWLAKDITTGNVVERLAICSEFGLVELREKILEQLILNRVALQEVVNSPQVLKFPELMQVLLRQTLLPMYASVFPRAGDSQGVPAAKKAKIAK